MKIRSVAAKEDIRNSTMRLTNIEVLQNILLQLRRTEKYKKCNSFNKKQFYNKFEGDILSYEHALERLKLNIKTDTPLDNIVSLVDEYKLQMDDLSDTLNVI